MNFVTFTDGDSGTMHAIQDEKMASKKVSSRSYRGERIIIINKKRIELNSYRATQDLLQNMAKTLNVKTMGFFMADDAHHFRQRVGMLSQYCDQDIYHNEDF